MSTSTTAYYALGAEIECDNRDALDELEFANEGELTVILSGDDDELKRILCIRSTVVRCDCGPVDVDMSKARVPSLIDSAQKIHKCASEIGATIVGSVCYKLFWLRL